MDEFDISYIRRCTIWDAFSRIAGPYRDKVCMVFKDRSWTYGELSSAIDRVSRRLSYLGYEKGDRIAAYGRNSDAYVILMLACNRAGIIHVPLNFGLVGQELEYVLTQSGAKAVVADHQVVELLIGPLKNSGIENVGTFYGGYGWDVLSWSLVENDLVAPVARVSGEDIAQIIYTSGTTALPKGAVMTNASLLETHRSSINFLKFCDKTRGISALPFYHMVFHVNCLPYLLAGAFQVILDYADVGTILEFVDESKLDSLFLPPTVIVKLLTDTRRHEYDLSSLKQLIYGASSMPAKVLEEIKDFLPETKLYHIYGQTEAGLVSVLSPDQESVAPGSIGRPVFNFDTRVVDSSMNFLPDGQPGELVHHSPALMKGYWNNPEETRKAFNDGWFHSGDYGYRDEHGHFYIVDRIKDVINTGGVLVSSREVEDKIFTHSAVEQVAVFGVSHPVWIECVVAAVVLKAAASEVTEEELLKFLGERMASFKIPKRIIFVNELPVNPSGKILKRLIKEKYSDLFSEI